MTPEQLHEFKLELKEHIESAIKLTVNGKIDKMDAKLTQYIASDMAWKTEYEPYIEGLANLSGSAKVIVKLAMGISAIIAALIAIREFFYK